MLHFPGLTCAHVNPGAPLLTSAWSCVSHHEKPILWPWGREEKDTFISNFEFNIIILLLIKAVQVFLQQSLCKTCVTGTALSRPCGPGCNAMTVHCAVCPCWVCTNALLGKKPRIPFVKRCSINPTHVWMKVIPAMFLALLTYCQLLTMLPGKPENPGVPASPGSPAVPLQPSWPGFPLGPGWPGWPCWGKKKCLSIHLFLVFLFL